MIIFVMLLTFALAINGQLVEDSLQGYPLAHTKYGWLRGSYQQALNNRTYAAFTGVPYADPPEGNYRFELTRPLTPWNGTRNATEPAPSCFQYTEPLFPGVYPVMGQEDCLYVNIFTPSAQNQGNKTKSSNCGPRGCSVIVYIHGGSFHFFSSLEFGGKYLMQTGEVIYVTLNYRLGILGFLSTEDKVLPGNNGLKDQLKALQFIKENIRAFGGNPGSITLTGWSAGGASVHLMYLNPQAANLFHRGIAVSGSALSYWAFQKASREKANKLATHFNCSTETSRKLVDCLKTKPGKDILLQTSLFQPYLYLPYGVFTPVVEIPNESAFLLKNPYDMLAAGEFQNKPLIMSVTEREGLAPAAYYIGNETTMAYINSSWNDIAPFLLDYNYTVKDELKVNVSQKIKNFYFGDGGDISVANWIEFVQLLTDRTLSLDTLRAALLHASKSASPVYSYMFSYRGASSFSEFLSQTKIDYGACHGDDLAYVLNGPFMNPETTANDRAMIDRFVCMWTSYATTGVPDFGNDVVWPRIDLGGQSTGMINYLQIKSPTAFSNESSYDFNNRTFWSTLPFNEPQSGRTA